MTTPTLGPADLALLIATTKLRQEWKTKGLLDYVKRMRPSYEVAPHHRAIADVLERVEAHVTGKPHECPGAECTRQMIYAPPQHGKSELVSKLFPAWFLGRNPDMRVVVTSYAQILADQASTSIREQLDDSRYPYPPKSGRGPAPAWDLRAPDRGSVKAAGRSGSITGFGANLIIIDDPVKDAQEADSPVVQEEVWTWYSETLRSRLVNPGAIVLVNTRWNYRDLSGRLEDEEKNGGDKWSILSLPALAEEQDVLGRFSGEALWEKRFPVSFLQSQQNALGSRAFDAQYQQRPTPKGGNLIKPEWFKTVQSVEVPVGLQWVRYWDLALSEKTMADYTASVAMAFDPKTRRIYVRDGLRGRWNAPDQVRQIKRVMNWERGKNVIHVVEENMHGTAILQELQGDRSVLGIPLRGVRITRANGNKVFRANGWIPVAERGDMYLVAPEESDTWIRDFKDECIRFPFGEHDDLIDAVSGALLSFRLAAASGPQRVKLKYRRNTGNEKVPDTPAEYLAWRRAKLGANRKH